VAVILTREPRLRRASKDGDTAPFEARA